MAISSKIIDVTTRGPTPAETWLKYCRASASRDEHSEQMCLQTNDGILIRANTCKVDRILKYKWLYYNLRNIDCGLDASYDFDDIKVGQH